MSTKWTCEHAELPLYYYWRPLDPYPNMIRAARVVRHHKGLKAHVFRVNGSDAITKLFNRNELEAAQRWVEEQELLVYVSERLEGTR